MRSNDLSARPDFWEQVIDYCPTTVASTTRLVDVIQQWGQAPATANNQFAHTHDDCFLVVNGARWIGLLTSQDLLRAVAIEGWQQRSIGELLTQPSLSFTLTPDAQPIDAIRHFQQHQLRCLPVVDQHAALIGVIRADTLLQFSLAYMATGEAELMPHSYWQYEQTSVANEARWRSLIQNSSDLVFISNASSQILYMSPVSKRLLGYDPEEMIGTVGFEGVHPNDLASIIQAFTQLAQQPLGSMSEVVEYRFRHKNGDWIYLESIGTNLIDDPTVGGIVVNSRDVTERKSNELALRQAQTELELRVRLRTAELVQANEQLRLCEQAIHASSNGIVIADARSSDMPIISVNPAFERITGYQSAEVLGRNCRFLQGNDRNQPAIAKLRTAIQAQTDCTVILQNYRKDSGLFWNELSISPIFNESGQLTHYVGIQKDITDQQKNETALQQQLAAIEAATVGIAILNFRFEYVYINHAHVNFFGYADANQLMGKSWQVLYAPDEIARIQREVFPILHQTGKYFGEAIAQRADGSTFPQEISLTMTDNGGLVCVCQDISDRKRDEAKRQQSEERLHLLESAVVHARDAIIITDAQLSDEAEPRILYVNQAFTQITGYSPETAIGQTLQILQGKQTKRTQLNKIREALTHQQPIRLEILNYRQDGSDYWADLTIVPIHNTQGQCINWVATQRDITERKNVEQILLATQARLKYLLSSSPTVIYTCKPFGNYATTFISENITALLGYDAWDFLKHPDFWLSHVHPDDVPTVLATLAELPQVDYLSFEYRLLSKTEGYIWLQDSFKLLRDSAGQPVEIIGSMLNISDRKQAEKALQESQQFLKLVMDNIPQAIFWKDQNLQFLGCNRQFAQDIGLTDPKEILGKTDFDMPWSKEAENHQADDARVVASDQPQLNIEEQVSNSDSSDRWLRMSKIPLHDETGNVVGILGTYEDVTKRKQAEEKLKASLHEKEVLLKEIHHRVKNNLQVISSLLKLQAGYIKDSQILDILKESQNRVRAMALIHEKLYQSKDLAKTDFAEYIRNLTCDVARSYGNPFNIRIEIDVTETRLSIDTAIPCGLIINELVSNALKYAFSSQKRHNAINKINISFHVDPQENYILTIADNGIGLPKELDFRNTSSLGLQLVCTLIEQLKGSIELDQSNGTTFKCTFMDSKQKYDE
jgi:PAS domain S-box-containing protein